VRSHRRGASRSDRYAKRSKNTELIYAYIWGGCATARAPSRAAGGYTHTAERARVYPTGNYQ